MPRTTVNIPDNTLTQLKQEAAEANTSLSKLITEKLRTQMQTIQKYPEPYELEPGTLGEPTGTYSREEIYEDIIKHRT